MKIHDDIDVQIGNNVETVTEGVEELEQGNIVLKDMKTGTVGTISLEKLTDDPKSIFNLEML